MPSVNGSRRRWRDPYALTGRTTISDQPFYAPDTSPHSASDGPASTCGPSERTASSSIASFAIMARGASRSKCTASGNFSTAGVGQAERWQIEEADAEKAAYLAKGGVLIA